jgi:hypothetical protein
MRARLAGCLVSQCDAGLEFRDPGLGECRPSIAARFGGYEPLAGEIPMQVLRDPACTAGGALHRTMVALGFRTHTFRERNSHKVLGVAG